MSKVPSTGDIRFLSNANSVCQVFGLGTANVAMTSLDGKEVRKAEPGNSNWITATTISKPISLRNLAGGFVGTIAAPDINAFGVTTDQNINVYRNTFDSGDGNESNNYTPTFDQYFGVGSSPGADNIMGYARIGFFNWQATPIATIAYYVSIFTSNHVTGEKGLLYVSGPITATNP